MRTYTLEIQRGNVRTPLGDTRELTREDAEEWASEAALEHIGSSMRWSWSPCDDSLERVIIKAADAALREASTRDPEDERMLIKVAKACRKAVAELEGRLMIAEHDLACARQDAETWQESSTCQRKRAAEAEARVAELEALLRRIQNDWHWSIDETQMGNAIRDALEADSE